MTPAYPREGTALPTAKRLHPYYLRMATGPEHPTTFREALAPSALRAALVPRRPVFANPWDSEADMFAVLVAIAFLDPFLLFLGGELMGSIFGFSSHWHLGVFM